MSFIDDFNEALRSKPDEIIMEFKGRYFSRGEVAQLGRDISDLLIKSGVPAEAAIGIVVRNRPIHAATIIGLIAASRPFTMIYAFQSPALLARDVEETQFAAVIADEEDWSKDLIDAAHSLNAVGIQLSLSATHPISYVTEAEHCRRSQFHTIDGEPALEILSSGTTGKPKRVKFPFRMLVRSVESSKAGQLDDSLPADISTWPYAGIGGLGNLVSNIYCGRYMCVLERFNVSEWVEAVRKHRPSYVSGPPAVAQMIVDAAVPPEDLESIKYYYGGSAPMPQELKDALQQNYGITTIWAYGATEFCGTVISWTVDLHKEFGESKKGAMGKPIPGVEVRVVDTETGRPLPVGEQGFLEAKVAAIGDEWIRTTDLAMVDEDGFFFHRGRGDGAILRGGFKVLPETIVNALTKHPAVFDAAVVGLTDARLGQVPVAAIQLRSQAEPISPEKILEFLRTELPSTYIPREVKIVEVLPRTPSLKIDLRAVRAFFE